MTPPIETKIRNREDQINQSHRLTNRKLWISRPTGGRTTVRAWPSCKLALSRQSLGDGNGRRKGPIGNLLPELTESAEADRRRHDITSLTRRSFPGRRRLGRRSLCDRRLRRNQADPSMVDLPRSRSAARTGAASLPFVSTTGVSPRRICAGVSCPRFPSANTPRQPSSRCHRRHTEPEMPTTCRSCFPGLNLRVQNKDPNYFSLIFRVHPYRQITKGRRAVEIVARDLLSPGERPLAQTHVETMALQPRRSSIIGCPTGARTAQRGVFNAPAAAAQRKDQPLAGAADRTGSSPDMAVSCRPARRLRMRAALRWWPIKLPSSATASFDERWSAHPRRSICGGPIRRSTRRRHSGARRGRGRYSRASPRRTTHAVADRRRAPTATTTMRRSRRHRERWRN